MTTKQAQNLLSYLGYYVLTYADTKVIAIDGDWGQCSIVACKAFQSDFGLPATGKLDDATQKALKHSVAYGIEKKTETKDIWNNINYFNKTEFKCKCGGKYCNGYPAEMDKTLLLLCDTVRAHFNAPMVIESGLRCATHNANVGGVSNSKHMSGKAVDLYIPGVSAKEIIKFLKTLADVSYCYAITETNVHMDVI